MVRSLLVLFLCLMGSTLVAQYVPNSNQAFQFAPVLNPAFSGLEGYRDLKLSYRYQWSGFGGDAPKFINLSYNFRVKEPLDLTLHSLRTNSTTTRCKKDDIPPMKKVIHGLGVNVFNETVGPINRLGGGVNYAFHYPIKNTLWLSTGVSALLDNTKINLDKLTLDVNPDPFYDRLVSNGSNHTELNVRAGVLLYSPRFYVGLSYLPIVNTSIKTSEVTAMSCSTKAPFRQAQLSRSVLPSISNPVSWHSGNWITNSRLTIMSKCMFRKNSGSELHTAT